MKTKPGKLMNSVSVKIESVGKWGCKKAGAIISIPYRQSLIYTSTAPMVFSFTYSLIH